MASGDRFLRIGEGKRNKVQGLPWVHVHRGAGDIIEQQSQIHERPDVPLGTAGDL